MFLFAEKKNMGKIPSHRPLSLRRRLANYKVFMRLRGLSDSPLSLFLDGVANTDFLDLEHDAHELLTSLGLEKMAIIPFSYDTSSLLTVLSLPLCGHISSLPKSLTIHQKPSGFFLSHSLSDSTLYLLTLMGPRWRTG